MENQNPKGILTVPKSIIAPSSKSPGSEQESKKSPARSIHLEVPTASNEPGKPSLTISHNSSSSSTTSSSSIVAVGNANTTSGVASVSVSPSPRSKPRLSFDEISIQKQEEWRKQAGERNQIQNQNQNHHPQLVSTISDQVPPHAAVSVNELRKSHQVISGLRRSSNISVPSGGDTVTTEPSIHSGQSHPSLQDDMCSEIVRLENAMETRNNSLSFQGKNLKLRRFVHVFQASF